MICVAVTILAGLPTSFQLDLVGSPAQGKGELGGLFGADERGLWVCLWLVARTLCGALGYCTPVSPPRPRMCLQTHAFIQVLVLCRIPKGLALGPVPQAGTSLQQAGSPISQGPALASSINTLVKGAALHQGVDGWDPCPCLWG